MGSSSEHISEPFAGVLAEKAIRKAGLEQPYGGPDWFQKSGYEIRHEIYRTTKRAVLQAGGQR